MVTGHQKHNRPQNTLHSAADNDCYRTAFLERNKHKHARPVLYSMTKYTTSCCDTPAVLSARPLRCPALVEVFAHVC